MTSGPKDSSIVRFASGPGLWQGKEIQQRGTYIYELSRLDLEELEAALRNVVSQNLNPARLCREQFPLPQLGVAFQAIKRDIDNGIGFSLLRGLPIERYSLLEAATLLCGIGAHFGRQMPQNSQGELLSSVRQVGPAEPPEKPARGYQSGLALPFHSDSCDIVGLLCICDAKVGGLSSIASSYAIHNAILGERLDLLQSLYQPFWIDRHGEGSREDSPYYSTPVFMWHNGRLFSRYNPGYVYSAQRYRDTPRLTPQQTDAIEMFSWLCGSDQFRLDMKLRPGDLQLLNNNVIVHSRTAYQDYSEAARKRHLLRLWLFTFGINDIPGPMRDRYHDMTSWEVNSHLPKYFG
ncbi:MAG: TauD/TfdA family dioxygenase [Candidatus Korobacteraceae bacterium]